MNDQPLRIWKKVAAPISRYYPNIRIERQRKTTIRIGGKPVEI
jgi:hypothetical protein